MYRRFIGGPTIGHAIRWSVGHRWIPIFDYAREGARNVLAKNNYVQRMQEDIPQMLPGSCLAIKASSFYKDMGAIVDVVGLAKERKLNVLFDAEDSSKTVFEDECVRMLYACDLPVYKTYQAYRRDCIHRLMLDLQEGMVNKFKIVRGAYLKSDPERDKLLYWSKSDVDACFDDCVDLLVNKPNMQVLIATHNAQSAMRVPVGPNVSFAQLLGMADGLTAALVAKGAQSHKYVPYGSFWETMPYLSRRLVENGGLIKYILD